MTEQTQTSRIFKIAFVALLSTLYSSCKTGGGECLCIRSIVYHSLSSTAIHRDTLDKIIDCRDFISNTGSLAFKTSELMYRQGEHRVSKEFLLNSISNGAELSLVYEHQFVNDLLKKALV